MISFLQSIVEYITNIFQWFLNVIENSLVMMKLLAQTIVAPFELYGYVPTFIAFMISAVVSVGVIKLILGWGNT